MKKMTDTTAASRPAWDMLKTFARTQVQGFIQHLLEDEVTELLGRAKSARRAPLDASAGARNGQGKPRQLALMNGTITVRRPDRYLHGLALGDFELALRGLLGDAAPLSASALVRLRRRGRRSTPPGSSGTSPTASSSTSGPTASPSRPASRRGRQRCSC